MSPGVRMKSGHLKNRLPAVRLGRHFPQAGNRAFSQVVRLFFVAAHRLPFWKAITSENCGFVLCTKCGPCRTARKQFSKGCEADRRAAAPKKCFKNTFSANSRVWMSRRGFSLERQLSPYFSINLHAPPPPFLPKLRQRQSDGKNRMANEKVR